MKPLLIAAALLLLPAGAQAQVAAASMPNSFDSPVRVAQTAPPAAVPAAPAPAHPRAEAVLRDIIAGAQAGTIDYALMSDDLAARVREQQRGDANVPVVAATIDYPRREIGFIATVALSGDEEADMAILTETSDEFLAV